MTACGCGALTTITHYNDNNNNMFLFTPSDEDVDIKALVEAWLKTLPRDNELLHSQLESWLEYFFRALEWVNKAADYVVDTTLVGVAMNGLSHLVGVTCKAEFVCALSRGLGANLNRETREKFAKEVFQWAQEAHPDPKRPLNTAYDAAKGRLFSYQLQVWWN